MLNRKPQPVTFAEFHRLLSEASTVIMSARGVQMVPSRTYLTVKHKGKVEGVFMNEGEDVVNALELYNDLVRG